MVYCEISDKLGSDLSLSNLIFNFSTSFSNLENLKKN